MKAALFVEKDGVYANRPDIELWDLARDARKYRGPHQVICHSPCARWGSFYAGQPGKGEELRGDDGGCFASALWSVRTFGGIIEHPAGSSAWRWFGLPTPGLHGWWGSRDSFGGVTCCVEQGHYGHPAPKPTWLYAVGTALPQLKWGPSGAEGRVESMSKKARLQTPPEFRDVLMWMVGA